MGSVVAEALPWHAAAWYGYLVASITPGVAAAVAVAAVLETLGRTEQNDKGTATTNKATRAGRGLGLKKMGRCVQDDVTWYARFGWSRQAHFPI